MTSHRLEGELSNDYDILTQPEFGWCEILRFARPCTVLALGSGKKLGHKETCFILKQLSACKK